MCERCGECSRACWRARARRSLHAQQAEGASLGASAALMGRARVRYAWVAVWYAFGVFEMVYVKRVVDSVPMTSWSRTYYQARPPRMAANAVLPGLLLG